MKPGGRQIDSEQRKQDPPVSRHLHLVAMSNDRIRPRPRIGSQKLENLNLEVPKAHSQPIVHHEIPEHNHVLR